MIPFPFKKYGVVYADPAWEAGVGTKSRPQHYPRMTLADIAALPVKGITLPDCWLFMWIPSNRLILGHHLPIMKAWGFKPSAVAFTWIKTRRNASSLFMVEEDLHKGMGYTTRKNAEFCLLGRRGAPRREAADVHEVIISNLQEHSRKPEEAARRIERFAKGPYIELNSRTTRQGWDAWGNEVGKFATV